MFRGAKGGPDRVRFAFLGRVAIGGWRGPRGGDGEEVNEFVIVRPLRASPLEVFGGDGDWDGVVVTISPGWCV